MELVNNTRATFEMAKAFHHHLRDDSNDYNTLIQKLESITKHQRRYIRKILNELALKNPDSAKLIFDYILDEQTRFNIKESTKEGKIKTLVWLSSHFNHEKPFNKITKEDILSYLNGLPETRFRRS